jgi:TPP-dependent pyruvate/acetoin dehydrogenase alpha subunit
LKRQAIGRGMSLIDGKSGIRIGEEVEKEIEDAVYFAEKSPDPEPDDYREYIFA